jgi:cbb3-type cytochrome oxidase maturation protein
MDILFLLIPLSLVLLLAIGWTFWWALSNNQFEELDKEANRVVEDKEDW